LLDRYLAAAGDKRLAVRSEIESAGLGALPGVLERRDRARKKSERAVWKELAKRLSCIVSEVKIGARSAKPDARLVRRLESLKGKPLDARVFLRTVGSVLKKSANPRGIRVAAVRAGDGTGFSVTFDFLANPKNAKGPPSQWGSSENIKAGKEFLLCQSGGTSDAGLSQWPEGNCPDLEKVLTQAIASDPDQPVEIRIRVAPEWRKAGRQAD
jgi:hypothetical protein